MSSSNFARKPGRAESLSTQEELAKKRQLSGRPKSSKPKKENSQEETQTQADQEQMEKSVNNDTASVETKEKAEEVAPEQTDTGTNREGTDEKQNDLPAPTNEVDTTISEPIEEDIPLVEPKEEQVKLTSFNNERLIAFKDVMGISYKKDAVGLLLDIAEGIEQQLEGRAKKQYEITMRGKKEIFELNHWKMTK